MNLETVRLLISLGSPHDLDVVSSFSDCEWVASISPFVTQHARTGRDEIHLCVCGQEYRQPGVVCLVVYSNLIWLCVMTV